MGFSNKFIAIVISSIILFSCSKNDEGQSSQDDDNQGVRLKYFESVQAIGDEIDFFYFPVLNYLKIVRSWNSGIIKMGSAVTNIIAPG